MSGPHRLASNERECAICLDSIGRASTCQRCKERKSGCSMCAGRKSACDECKASRGACLECKVCPACRQWLTNCVKAQELDAIWYEQPWAIELRRMQDTFSEGSGRSPSQAANGAKEGVKALNLDLTDKEITAGEIAERPSEDWAGEGASQGLTPDYYTAWCAIKDILIMLAEVKKTISEGTDKERIAEIQQDEVLSKMARYTAFGRKRIAAELRRRQISPMPPQSTISEYMVRIRAQVNGRETAPAN